MKFKVVAPNDSSIIEILSTEEWEEIMLEGVCSDIYNISNVLEREAEFYVQKPDVRLRKRRTPILRIEIRLSGVTRNGRSVSTHHNALKRMVELTAESLSEYRFFEVYGVLMLDGEIPSLTDETVYTNMPDYLLKGSPSL